MSADELASLRRDRPPIVEEVMRDGITLAGGPASSVLGRLR
jgi:hypothetical protein